LAQARLLEIGHNKVELIREQSPIWRREVFKVASKVFEYNISLVSVSVVDPESKSLHQFPYTAQLHFAIDDIFAIHRLVQDSSTQGSLAGNFAKTLLSADTVTSLCQ
jgi:hypothetical protein